MKKNPYAISKWIEALRSGKYKQSQDALHDSDGYCCLGVACDLYLKEHPDAAEWTTASADTYRFRFRDRNGKIEYLNLPQLVMSWLGVRTPDGEFVDVYGYNRTLAHLNDNGRSFEEIAQIIESGPEKLFVD